MQHLPTFVFVVHSTVCVFLMSRGLSKAVTPAASTVRVASVEANFILAVKWLYVLEMMESCYDVGVGCRLNVFRPDVRANLILVVPAAIVALSHVIAR